MGKGNVGKERELKMSIGFYRICSQCGEEKEVCCLVDGEPWCEECFERALGDGEEKD